MISTQYMNRSITKELLAWKNAKQRKPIILKGARQVGKTAVLKEFGKREFQDVAYVSLEKISSSIPSPYASLFESSLHPKDILKNLFFALHKKIEPEKTLLILDEIQDCPAAISSLKYFCEEMPELHVACAGSLLGVALASKNAFPVGKVSFLTLYPMSFTEFLEATEEQALALYVEQVENTTAVPDFFHKRLITALKNYFAVGGMPEAVLAWKETQDIAQVDVVLSDLLDAYERDFVKHGGERQFSKILSVWHSLPSQLSRENKKFLYGAVSSGARAREYEDAITWLEAAGLVYKVKRSSKPALPLSAMDQNAFKLYLFDVGILRRLSRLDALAFEDEHALFSEFKGAFAENFTLQALLPRLDVMPRYWAVDNPHYEVDFLLQVKNDVLPLEVKSGENVKSKSLRAYMNKFGATTPVRLRVSLLNLAFDGGLLNIPLYLASNTIELVNSLRKV